MQQRYTGIRAGSSPSVHVPPGRMADQLLARGRSLVEDMRPGPVAFSQPRVQEYAEVVPDGAEREPGDGR